MSQFFIDYKYFIMLLILFYMIFLSQTLQIALMVVVCQ